MHAGAEDDLPYPLPAHDANVIIVMIPVREFGFANLQSTPGTFMGSAVWYLLGNA